MSVTKRVVRIIFGLTLIVLFGCGIAIAAGVFSNGFESVRTRYVLADGAVVKKNGTVKFADSDIKFELTGAGFKAVDWGDYTVSIAANAQAGVEFEVNGEAYAFNDMDFTERFAIEKGSNSFIVKNGEYQLDSVLKTLYGENLKIKNYNYGTAPYVVTVTASNGKEVFFYLDCGIEKFKITLTPSETVF